MEKPWFGLDAAVLRACHAWQAAWRRDESKNPCAIIAWDWMCWPVSRSVSPFSDQIATNRQEWVCGSNWLNRADDWLISLPTLRFWKEAIPRHFGYANRNVEFPKNHLSHPYFGESLLLNYINQSNGFCCANSKPIRADSVADFPRAVLFVSYVKKRRTFESIKRKC